MAKLSVLIFYSKVWELPESKELVTLVSGRRDFSFEYAGIPKKGQRPWECFGGRRGHVWYPTGTECMEFHLRNKEDVTQVLEIVQRTKRSFLEAFARDPVDAMRMFNKK